MTKTQSYIKLLGVHNQNTEMRYTVWTLHWDRTTRHFNNTAFKLGLKFKFKFKKKI